MIYDQTINSENKNGSAAAVAESPALKEKKVKRSASQILKESGNQITDINNWLR